VRAIAVPKSTFSDCFRLLAVIFGGTQWLILVFWQNIHLPAIATGADGCSPNPGKKIVDRGKLHPSILDSSLFLWSKSYFSRRSNDKISAQKVQSPRRFLGFETRALPPGNW
jgi:hypothetical protein